MARACSTVGGHSVPFTAPHAETAVRSASIAPVDGGRRRRTSSTAGGSGAQARCASVVHSPVHSELGDLRVRAALDELADRVAAVLKAPASPSIIASEVSPASTPFRPGE